MGGSPHLRGLDSALAGDYTRAGLDEDEGS